MDAIEVITILLFLVLSSELLRFGQSVRGNSSGLLSERLFSFMGWGVKQMKRLKKELL